MAVLQFQWFFLAAIFSGTIASINTLTATNTAKPGCQRKCGNLTIPYPFGIGLDGKCSIGHWYNINCNTSFNSPKAFIADSKLEIVDISENNMRIKNSVARRCYNSLGELISSNDAYIDISPTPFTFSSTLNSFTLVGCDDLAIISEQFTNSGCISLCSTREDVIEGPCSGSGCCQSAIHKGLNTFIFSVVSLNNHTNVFYFNPCIYSFLAETGRFKFRGLLDLSDPTFLNRTVDNVPIVLDWGVGNGTSCNQAKKDLATYPCQANTTCIDLESASMGYGCHCLPGYEGNPYLNPGCQDIDECTGQNNPCYEFCTNSPGSYKCSCSKGLHGDGLKNGTGCAIASASKKSNSRLLLQSTIGTSLGVLILFTCASLGYLFMKKIKLAKLKEKFFEKNGGLLLRLQLSSSEDNAESTKVFTATELLKATNNYSEDRILGKGGYGTVYKGIFVDCVAAIKKSRIDDDSQIEQFINEVVILTRIHHRNVVQLLGCCLETEVPLLVYEFVSHGTLHDHIHNNIGASWLSWVNCVRISLEISDALSYLHSAANPPIIHRDIKSTNILIDDTYTAKISDFGASRLVRLDQTQVTTLVQGTLGYLDPEYFQSSQLTEKSDVYSFGVVLAELLTREKPLRVKGGADDKNLAMYFLLAMKEDRVLEIVYPELMKETNEEQLVSMAKLIQRCLNVKGEERPTMKEVSMELEGLKKSMKHPWAERNNAEDTSLLGHSQQDLYPLPTNALKTREEGDLSGQYIAQMDEMVEMNHPR